MKSRFPLGIGMLLVGLSGCVSIPYQVQGQVENVSVVEARKIERSPVVRWGGVIARVQNNETHSTVEIVAKPLSYNTRPLDNDGSGGRFIAIIPEFIDPVVYQAGREITVIGNLKEMLEGKIGDMKYIFPIVQVSGHYLWKKRPLIQEVHYYPISYWPVFPHYYHHRHYWHPHPKKKSKSEPNN